MSADNEAGAPTTTRSRRKGGGGGATKGFHPFLKNKVLVYLPKNTSLKH